MSQRLEVGIDRLLDLLLCPICHSGKLEVLQAELTCNNCGKLYQTCNEVPIFLPDPQSVRIVPLDHQSHSLPEEVINWLRNLEGYSLNIGGGATEIKIPRCIELEYSLFKNTDVVGDAHNLPFKDGAFDAVVSFNAFEHLHNPFAAAREIFRVLKPGGKVIIQTAFLVPLHEEPAHYFNTTEYGLRRWFSDFNIESCTIPGNFSPALAFEWLASDLLYFVTQALGSEVSQQLAATTLDDLRRAWVNETGERYGTFFQLIAQLPQHIQSRFAAGFELTAQRPVVQNGVTLSNELFQKEETKEVVQEQRIKLEHLQLRLEQYQAELEHLKFQLQHTHSELAQSQSQLQHVQVGWEQGKNRITAMESSKFWKLRTAWFRLKNSIGIKEQSEGTSAPTVVEQSGRIEALAAPAALKSTNEAVPSLERESIANIYIKGSGIEIGALHNPLTVPKSANVKYVDRMSIPDLRKQYPELESLELVNVDIIADGERLETIQDATQDFVIINHFLEHCQNPVLAVSNIFRVLKNDGIVYVALPDKRYSFDVERPATPTEHFWRDYKEGPEWSRKQHFEEWTRLVGKMQDDTEVEKHVNWLMEIDYSIHYHVFTQDDMLDFFSSIKKNLNLNFDIELLFKNGTHEVIFILRKLS